MNRITTFLKTGHIAAASLLVFGLARAGAQASQGTIVRLAPVASTARVWYANIAQ